MEIQWRKDGFTVFIFNLKPARKVYLAGEFNNWNPAGKCMVKMKDGTFRAKIKPQPGDYEYKFIADGIWINDPTTEDQINLYGTANSVVRVR